MPGMYVLRLPAREGALPSKLWLCGTTKSSSRCKTRCSCDLVYVTPEFKMQAARYMVSVRAPYFSAALFSLYPQEVDKIRVRTSEGVLEQDTFAVTSTGILLYTRAAVEKWDVDEIAFVLAHEVLHVLLDHMERCVAAKYDPYLWNIAADVFINDQLRAGGWKKWPRTQCWPETWSLPRGRTADEYYRALIDKSPKLKNDAFGACGSGAGNTLENEADLPGEAQEAARSADEMDIVKQQAVNEMAAAEKKHAGTLPGGLSRWVDAVKGPPKVSWQDKLRRAGSRACEAVAGQQDYVFGGLNRRQGAVGWGPGAVLLPRLVSYKPRVLIAIDTSASMSKRDIAIGLREVDGIFQSLHASVSVASFDAQVQDIVVCKDWKQAARSLKGGGGTSFIPVFSAAERQKPRPNLVVVVTDGFGEAPPRKPTWCDAIFLLVGKSRGEPCTWGKMIHVKD